MTATGAAGLEPPEREGEERRTRGRKARPARVFTMLEPKKEKKWIRGCEMKMREKMGGFI